MVAGKSPEWLPPGFTEKVKYKNGRKIKYYYHAATGKKYHSKKDVLSCAMTDNGHLGTPQRADGDDNRLSSNNKIDAGLAKTNDSPEWLPNGWKMEEKTRQSGFRKGAIYKVYTELSSGSKFYSRAAVARYMKTVEHANTKNAKKKVDHLEEPIPDVSPSCISMTNTDHIPEKKLKNSSFKTVAIESAAADDLPPGWIKEIKTSKSGNRIRKDPFYTDPVSGYMFRSKLDALRYLKTNDIRSCACRPRKRELDDPKLITNEISSPSPANKNEKLSEHKRQLFPFGEINDGGESSGTKSQAQTAAEITEQTQHNNEPDSVKVSSVGVEGNSNKKVEMENNHEPANEVSKEDHRESGMKKRSEAGLRKSKKRRDLSLPSRTSKRLAGGEPEIVSNSVLSKRSLRAAARRSSGNGIKINTPPSFSPKALAATRPSEIEPVKEDPKYETLQVPEPLNQVENGPLAMPEEKVVEAQPPAIPEEKVVEAQPDDNKRSQETGQPNDDKRSQESEQPGDNKRSQETDQPDDNKRSQESEQPDDNKNSQESEQPGDNKRSQESELCYDFGDSWSDPLEFALKTLRGEISIDDTLAFPGGFDEHQSIPYNQTLKQSQPDAPIIFRNEFVPPSESSKQKSPVNQFAPNSSSFSALGKLWSGFNNQSSTEATKQDCPTKFNP
ncbi:hypothetical protein CDL12_00021 [Handroanthus impetiginosus]|uniref:MBD domain-containing protein n=1 Tax=Handroanthus impetiginosus TaxID=429701 RepID=A0A2G9IBU5_9LAMI|nr:hypothetical protein CDL12_00021 [Handroanthus impetiginosus]